MNILHNKATRAALAAAAAILVCACQQAPRFTIEGKVENAAARTLYLLNIGTNNTARIDSAKLGENGEFSFSHKSPDCYDFYALQLQNAPRRITIAIDSTETVTVTTTAAHFADSCTISGSPQSIKIRELAMLEKSLHIGKLRRLLLGILLQFKSINSLVLSFLYGPPLTPIHDYWKNRSLD